MDLIWSRKGGLEQFETFQAACVVPSSFPLTMVTSSVPGGDCPHHPGFQSGAEAGQNFSQPTRNVEQQREARVL